MEELKDLGVGKSIEEIRSILNQEIITISADLSFVSNGWYIICTNILYRGKIWQAKVLLFWIKPQKFCQNCEVSKLQILLSLQNFTTKV